ncbi:MAG: nuclear transport factor 2 family protein [Pseudomonadota bacterium]
MKKILISLFIIAAFSSNLSIATDKKFDADKKGKELLNEIWSNMKDKKIDALDKMISEGFQAVHTNGANTKTDEMKLLKGLNLSDYEFSDIKVTQNGPVLLVTYFVKCAETIDGKKLEKKKAERLTVFLETDGKWQWIAHANLRALNN